MFGTWVGKSLWRRKWQPTPVFLPEKSYGQRGHNWVTKHIPLCVCVCHIFNHWSVHGQLGCFRITRVCMCLFKLVGFFFFFSVMYLEVKLLDHMIVLFLVFWGPSILFPTVVAPVYIPTNSVQEFSVGFIFKPFVGCLDEVWVSHADLTTVCGFLDINLTFFLSLARAGSHGRHGLNYWSEGWNYHHWPRKII